MVKKRKSDMKLFLNKVSVANLEETEFVEVVGLPPTVMKGIYAAEYIFTVKTFDDRTCVSSSPGCGFDDGEG